MTVLMLGRQLELGYYRAVYLQSHGFQVIFPENKDAALVAIRTGGYDAVIISYTLSKESANEFVNLVKQRDKDCPVVAIMQERSDKLFGAPGTMTSGSIGSRSKYTHTYRVQTGTKILELDCGQEAMFHSTGSECGGKNPLKVGDVIHFRVEKEWVYIPIVAKVPVDDFDSSKGTREEQSDQKLRILSENEAPKESAPAPPAQVGEVAAANITHLSIASTPTAADIEVDGGFVGNTPSTIEISPGDHTVIVSKSGYKTWERKLKAGGGNVNLNAELETQPK